MFGQAGAAALDLSGPGGDGVASVVAHEHQRVDEQHEPENQMRHGFSEHGSALPLEWLMDRHKGRGPAAVVHNVPVLRGTERGHVFRAGISPLHTIGTRNHPPDTGDQIHSPNDREHSRRAALGASCGRAGVILGRRHVQDSVRGADRALAVRSVRLAQVRTE